MNVCIIHNFINLSIFLFGQNPITIGGIAFGLVKNHNYLIPTFQLNISPTNFRVKSHKIGWLKLELSKQILHFSKIVTINKIWKKQNQKTNRFLDWELLESRYYYLFFYLLSLIMRRCEEWTRRNRMWDWVYLTEVELYNTINCTNTKVGSIRRWCWIVAMYKF